MGLLIEDSFVNFLKEGDEFGTYVIFEMQCSVTELSPSLGAIARETK